MVMAHLHQADYARASFHHALVLLYNGENNTSIMPNISGDSSSFNEEVGEMLLSALARTISSQSSRSDIRLVEDNLLTVSGLSSVIEASDGNRPLFFERRSTRNSLDFTTPTVVAAKKFWAATLAALEADTFGFYTSDCYLNASTAEANMDRDTILPDPPDAFEYLEALIETEISRKSYTGNWIMDIKDELSPEVKDLLFPELIGQPETSSDDADPDQSPPKKPPKRPRGRPKKSTNMTPRNVPPLTQHINPQNEYMDPIDEPAASRSDPDSEQVYRHGHDSDSPNVTEFNV